MEDTGNGVRRTCAVCGERFRTPTERIRDWGYAVGSRPCCSYRCMRDLERRMRDKRMEKGSRSMRAMMYADWVGGMSYAELETKWHRHPKDIAMRLLLLDANNPELTEWIREKVARERRGA